MRYAFQLLFSATGHSLYQIFNRVMIIFAQLIETANEGESELIEAIEAFHNKEDMLSTMSQVLFGFQEL